jgi:iron(III) transport system ATP-binding protein
MVFQSYAIWPHLDVFENVAYPLRVQRPALARAEIRERVMDVLGLVGMQAMAERPAARLSGGQQQRVALARAVVRRPALLLLDEPLSNLDARLRETMRNELGEMIARVGVTALFVTHDQAEAFALADRVAVMDRGHIVQVGGPREIYAKPRASFIAAFLGAANLIDARVDSRDASGGARFVLDTPSQAHGLLLKSEMAAGAPVELVIRPEDIGLSTQALPGEPNVLTGTVERVNFLGGLVEYSIDIDGVCLKVLTHPSVAATQNQRVWLRVDDQRCAVFAREAHNL